jgi:hypothetical protein
MPSSAIAGILGLAVGLIVGCGTVPPPTAIPTPPASPSPISGGVPIDHPTGATDIVLRMEDGGGLMWRDEWAAKLPVFTLYGDGTFVFRPFDDRGPGNRPPLLHGRLDEGKVQALLEFALGTGRLLDARADYPDNTVVDGDWIVFTIDAGGISKRVSIVGGGGPDQPAQEAVDRAGFRQLAELLRSFPDRLEPAAAEVDPYAPSHYRVTLMEYVEDPDDPPPDEPADWPWEHLAPDDFDRDLESREQQAALSAEEVALIADVPTGGQTGIGLRAPDGSRWLAVVRPLLPDEMP